MKHKPRIRERSFVLQFGDQYYEMFCKEHSTDDSIGSVLLVPDFIGNSSDFDMLGTYLAANGVHAVAVDLPGRGRSVALPSEYGTLLNLASVVTAAAQGTAAKATINANRAAPILMAVLRVSHRARAGRK